MSRSVNSVVLLGNLGRDAETKFTPSGAAATRFSVATTRRWKNQSGEFQEETNWTNVVLWRQEKLATYLTKGKQVYVEGRLQTRSYDDKEGRKIYTTEVIADDVILLGGNGGSGGDDQYHDQRPQQRAQPQSKPTYAGKPPSHSDESDPYGGMGITDDDVPF